MEIGFDYDSTVTSYLGCWYFGMYGKKRPLAVVPIRCIGVHFLKFSGVVNEVLQKRVGKTRVK